VSCYSMTTLWTSLKSSSKTWSNIQGDTI